MSLLRHEDTDEHNQMVEDVIQDALVYADPSGKLVFRWSNDRRVFTAREVTVAAREVRLALEAVPFVECSTEGMHPQNCEDHGCVKCLLSHLDRFFDPEDGPLVGKGIALADWTPIVSQMLRLRSRFVSDDRKGTE